MHAGITETRGTHVMKHSFDPRDSLIEIPAIIVGPHGQLKIRLALDTGAGQTIIRDGALLDIGIDPSLSPSQFELFTASELIEVPEVTVDRMSVLGRFKTRFPVIAHTLPSGLDIDGVLGLDFLRGHRLTADFRAGLIELK